MNNNLNISFYFLTNHLMCPHQDKVIYTFSNRLRSIEWLIIVDLSILDELVVTGLFTKGKRRMYWTEQMTLLGIFLPDKRAEMRRLMGKRRVTYSVSEIRLIASFRLRRVDGSMKSSRKVYPLRSLQREHESPLSHIDPLQLDYRLVTETFGGPFAERHLVVTLENRDDGLTIAMAERLNIRAGKHPKCKGSLFIPSCPPNGMCCVSLQSFTGFAAPCVPLKPFMATPLRTLEISNSCYLI